MQQVVIAQPRMAQYRVPLFEHLRSLLAERNVDLRVVHGKAAEEVLLQRDEGRLGWGEVAHTRRLPGSAVWIPLASAIRQADMVVVPESAGWIPTYDLLARRMWRRQLVACWGHGPGQDDHASTRLSRRVRRILAPRFDWWFSYTPGTTDRLRRAGAPGERVTTLFNTIDVDELRRLMNPFLEQRAAVRNELGLSGQTGLFLGALRPSKRIDLVLEVGEFVAQRIEGFTLTVGGDGPLRGIVERKAATSPWLRYAGPVFGIEKARLLASADVMIQPVSLGLVVVDALAAGVPIVTFEEGNHSPEHEYLIHGRHGLRVQDGETKTLADEVVTLLEDSARREQLAAAAWEAGSSLRLERMVERFAEGIQAALESGPRRWW